MFHILSLIGTPELWPLLLGCPSVLIVIALALHFYLPSSPVYLAVISRDICQAKKGKVIIIL